MRSFNGTWATPVNPLKLAAYNSPSILGLGDFNWPEVTIDTNKLITDASGAIQTAINGMGGRDVHIAAQNRTVEAFAGVVSAYDRFKAAGQLTSTIIAQAISQISGLNAQFTNYARSVNTSRALQGARDVDDLARKIIAGMQADQATITGALPGLPGIPGFPGTGGGTSGGFDFSTLVPLGLVGVALLFLFKKRR